MALQNAEFGCRRIEGAPIGLGDAWFLQPTVDRIITRSGLAGGPLHVVLRRRAVIARRVAVGRQIMKIIAKSARPT